MPDTEPAREAEARRARPREAEALEPEAGRRKAKAMAPLDHQRSEPVPVLVKYWEAPYQTWSWRHRRLEAEAALLPA